MKENLLIGTRIIKLYHYLSKSRKKKYFKAYLEYIDTISSLGDRIVYSITEQLTSKSIKK